MSKKNKSIQNLIDNKKLLSILSDKSIKLKYKNAILKNADNKLSKAIEDSVSNLLKGNSKSRFTIA